MADINKVVNIKVESDIDKTTKDTKKLDKSLDGVSKTSEKTSKGIGAISKISKVASTGIKGIGTAISALGLGAILAPIGALTAIFAKNKKVIDAVTTTLNATQLAVNAVTDAISSAYEKVTEATNGFDALKKVIKGLLTVAITPLKLGFYAIKQALQEADLAFQKMFGDDGSVIEAQTALIETKKALSDVSKEAVQAGKDVVNNFSEAMSEVGEAASTLVDEVSKIDPKKILDTASAMTQLKNNAELAAATQAGMVEEFDRQAEALRQIRDEERNTIDERIKANNELKEVLENQRKSMLEQADLQIAAAQANVDANDSIENQVALIDALNNRKGVLAATEGFMSEQKVNDMALDKEAIELINSKAEADNALNIQKKRFLAEQMTDDEMRLEALRAVLEEEKLIELERLQNKVDSYNEGTQAFVDAQIELAAKEQEFYEADVALQNERTELENQRIQDAAEKQKQKEEIDKLEVQSRRDSLVAMTQLMGVFAQASEKDSKAFKALAVAGALVNTYLGISEVWSKKGSSPFVAASLAEKLAATATVAASGFGAVKGIKSAGKGSSGGGSGSLTSGSIPLPTSSSFSTIEQSQAEANQQANANAQFNNNNPIQAYVTSTDVASANALERNRIEDAGF